MKLLVLISVSAVLFWILRRHVFFRLPKELRSRLRLLQSLASPLSPLEKGFLSGVVDFKSILSPLSLSEREKRFLKKEVLELCRLEGEWEAVSRGAIGAQPLRRARKDGFFGLSISEKWGGLGFSKMAHSLVIESLASAHMPLAVFISTPNSIGPARLISRYGTLDQKKKYLPSFARGEKLPCFALTEQEAGSDMSVSSQGVVFKDKTGELKIRLSYHKRWITLAAAADVAAVVFRLQDPHCLLKGAKDRGLHLALLPLSPERRQKQHNILWIPFYNGPLEGQAVLPLKESLIGGLQRAGQGRRMIMESLDQGRLVGVPALALGGMARAVQTAGLYARIRRQFKRPIGQFEGVKESLARIGGLVFLSRALRDFILHQKEPSPAASALMKYHLSEFYGETLKNAMDILSGKGLSLGPKNPLGLLNTAAALFRVAEGAHILTRSFIISKNIMPHHPLLKMLRPQDKKDGLRFQKYIFKKSLKTLAIFCVRGFWTKTPCRRDAPAWVRRAFQKLSWSAALFSFFSDIFLLQHGSSFPFREKLSGRFSDIFSSQYMISALLWRYQYEALSDSEISALKWGLEDRFSSIQQGLEGLAWNMRFLKPLGFLLRWNPIGKPPSDRLASQTAEALLKDSALFKRLVRNVCRDKNSALHSMEKAARLLSSAEKALQKIQKAEKTLSKGRLKDQIRKAKAAGVLSAEEALVADRFQKALDEALSADTFPSVSF